MDIRGISLPGRQVCLCIDSSMYHLFIIVIFWPYARCTPCQDAKGRLLSPTNARPTPDQQQVAE
jgi:hypothetical protein